MRKKKKVQITGSDLQIEDVVAVARYNARIFPGDKVRINIQRNWNVIKEMLDEGKIIYGLNTGIGGFGNILLPPEKTAELSVRMLRAHASGYGEKVSEEISRATFLARINVLAKGYSGVRSILFETLVKMINAGINPVCYEKGSLGCSGDLAPLAQMMLTVIGEGEAYYKGKILPAREALKKAGVKPLKLAYREGLALINGSQMMTGIACLNIYDSLQLIKTSEIAASMTIQVLNCVESAYDARYHKVRPFKGQNTAAENIRTLIAGSDLMKEEKINTQNAYSLRAVPQVSGAVRDALDYVREIVEIELNSVADNPIFFTDDKTYLTGANFHGANVGYTQDLLGIVITDLGSISERRVNNLMDPACSGNLPAFLVKSAGLDSGLMIAQYTQAALVSENKVLASPASVDSIPTSANQEDHVSMGTIAARKAREIIRNTEAVVAIEILAACQAYEFRKPTKPSKSFQAVYDLVRSVSPAITEDRAFYKDIEVVVELVRSGKVLEAVINCGEKLK